MIVSFSKFFDEFIEQGGATWTNETVAAARFAYNTKYSFDESSQGVYAAAVHLLTRLPGGSAASRKALGCASVARAKAR